MKNVTKKEIEGFTPLPSYQNSGAPCVGKIIEITEAKEIKVDYVGNKWGPLVARITSTALSSSVIENIIGTSVLLLFEDGDLGLPIIIGVIQDNLDYEEGVLQERRPANGGVDGEVLTFDANYEIILRCGKSSITLTKDGKIVLKGTKLVSRSSGENKIKGSSVSIN